MGEYHTRTNRGALGGYETLWKFGTCEDWRYVRREQVEAVRHLDAGASADLGWALGPRGARFRFPFPDEDERAKRPDGFDNMFRRRALMPGPLTRAFLVQHVDHYGVQVTHECRTESEHPITATTNLTCPFSKDAKPFTTGSKGTWFNVSAGIDVVGQRWDDEMRPYTVFGCPYCAAPFRVPKQHFDVHLPAELRGRVLPSIEED